MHRASCIVHAIILFDDIIDYTVKNTTTYDLYMLGGCRWGVGGVSGVSGGCRWGVGGLAVGWRWVGSGLAVGWLWVSGELDGD